MSGDDPDGFKRAANKWRLFQQAAPTRADGADPAVASTSGRAGAGAGADGAR